MTVGDVVVVPSPVSPVVLSPAEQPQLLRVLWVQEEEEVARSLWTMWWRCCARTRGACRWLASRPSSR